MKLSDLHFIKIDLARCCIDDCALPAKWSVNYTTDDGKEHHEGLCSLHKRELESVLKQIAEVTS